MAIKACIFDLDGTLVNSIGDLHTAMNAVLASHGYPTVTEAQMKIMVGNGIRKLIERATPEGADIDACHREFTTYYLAHCLDKTVPYPGISELLAALQAHQIPLGVVSNKADPLAQHIVETLFPMHPFAFITGLRDGIAAKPDPSAPLAACRVLGVSPADCAMIGDSNVDMFTATNAGMRGFGVTWGFRSRQELAEGGAYRIVDTTDALLDALLAE